MGIDGLGGKLIRLVINCKSGLSTIIVIFKGPRGWLLKVKSQCEACWFYFSLWMFWLWRCCPKNLFLNSMAEFPWIFICLHERDIPLPLSDEGGRTLWPQIGAMV